MSHPDELQPTISIDSVNSTTPFKAKENKHDDDHINRPQLNDNATYSTTVVIKDQIDDLDSIKIEINKENDPHEKEIEEEKKEDMIYSPSSNLTNNKNNENSRSISADAESITNHTNDIDGATKENLLEQTTLRHDENDVEIGHLSSKHDASPIAHNNGASSPGINPRRMPSISYNTGAMEDNKDLAALRRASRRKWWSPTRVCDWCMHRVLFGKIMVMILTWTTVVDYSKDLYVAYHFIVNLFYWEFFVTLSILFLSLRLMLYLRATDDSSSISFWKLLIFYLPGSVYADFQVDRFSDIGVCLFWEIAILFGTPFVPFFLIYLAIHKSFSLFCSENSFENPYLLSYAVVECIFETIPQLSLQTYIYFARGSGEISIYVFIAAWCISILVLMKIPIVVWYNWRIVYKLSFKRRHCGEIISIAYHPQQDLIATGSWDHTVLISSIIDSSALKAKRVLDHHYNINCIAFHPHASSDIIAVAGQGVELFNWRQGKSIATFPVTRDRDPLRRRKRHRTKEVKQVLFHSQDNTRVIWCQGKNVLVYDLVQRKEVLKIKCIQGNRLGDVEAIDISPNGKYIAAGLYQSQIKVYNSENKDLIRVLQGTNASPVMCCKFDRFGKYIISGSADAVLRVFDLRSAQQIATFKQHTSDIMCVAIDYTNKYVACGGRDKTLYILYLDSLKILTKIHTQRDIRCVDFSPYGDTVSCATEDHQVHILSLPQECHVHQPQATKVIKKIVPNAAHHQKQYSNIERITTNDYNNFDPKEHNIF